MTTPGAWPRPGPTARSRLVGGEVVGRTHSASAHAFSATTMWHWTPGWKAVISSVPARPGGGRRPPRRRPRCSGARRRSRPWCRRRRRSRVATEGDLIGSRREFGRPRSGPGRCGSGRVVAESTCCRRRCRGHPGQDHCWRGDHLPPDGGASSVGCGPACSGILPPPGRHRLVRHPSGTHTTYFTRAPPSGTRLHASCPLTGGVPQPRTAVASRWSRTASTSLGSVSQRSGRSKRCLVVGRLGADPRACSTASGTWPGGPWPADHHRGRRVPALSRRPPTAVWGRSGRRRASYSEAMDLAGLLVVELEPGAVEHLGHRARRSVPIVTEPSVRAARP